MNKSKFIVVSKDVVPEVFLKVLEAKEAIDQGQVSGVSDAVKLFGISRSTYYKYVDHVFPLAEGVLGKKITISLLLSHESGVLSGLLQIIADKNCNILTISQDPPLNQMANASLTFDISELNSTFEELTDALRTAKGVKKLNIIAIE